MKHTLETKKGNERLERKKRLSKTFLHLTITDIR